MRQVLSMLVLAGALCGCATGAPPRLVNPAPPGIAYRIEGEDVHGTTQRAEQYCAQYGKHAALQGVSGAGKDRIANYACS